MNAMNETPLGERLHIGIFGKRNAGKSSLLNAITGQDAALVSPVKGTTTDPVYKTMELLPIGPVVFIDTPGIDDMGRLGALRVEKTIAILRKTNIAVLVVDASAGLSGQDKELMRLFKEKNVKFITVFNKADLFIPTDAPSDTPTENEKPQPIFVSAATGENINILKEEIIKLSEATETEQKLAADLLSPNDIVVLVIPIDKAAPKGRLILPQQQVLRDILDCGAVSIVCGPHNLEQTLNSLKTPPKLVITDSQVFAEAAKQTPENIGLTSFSILMARYKGLLDGAVEGAAVLDDIKNGDKILISEGCTHHRQCDDIGTVKLPKMIEKHTGAKPEYSFTSGGGFPKDLSEYKLIIHCGGCMLNKREMQYRSESAENAGIPMTNFGLAMSHMQGILERCIAAFGS